MKTITKIMAILLVLAMCVPFFSSCGKKEEETSPYSAEEQEAIKAAESLAASEDPKIEAVDYDGYEFTFISNLGTSYNCGYIVAEEEERGEILPDSIFKRNAILEEKYNIKVTHLTTPDIMTDVRAQVMSGMTEFDVIIASCSNLAIMAQEGLLYDLNSIDRFDMSKSYWDSNAAKELTIGGKLYFTNCAMNLSSIGFAVFFNKQLIEDYKLTSPYEYIENNEWTLDNWAKLVKSVSKDLDGDGKMNEFDQYGTLSEHHNPRMFLYGCGLRATTNSSDGFPEPTLMNEQNKNKTTTAYEKLKAVFSDETVCYCMNCSNVEANGFTHKWNYLRYLFTQDHYMFHYTSANGVTQFADMEHDFGIVPFPKYDSKQEQYKTMYPYNNLLVALPSSSSGVRLEVTATLLEDMNYISSYVVVPAWFEVLLKRRSTRDDESEKYLSVIRENCVYDVGMYYDFGGIRTMVLDIDIAGANIARNYARIQNGVSAAIQRTYQNYKK